MENEKLVCPFCGSENWACFNDGTVLVQDREAEGDAFEIPYGDLKCRDCGKWWRDYSVDMTGLVLMEDD